MSTLKVGAIRGVSASSDAITVANDGTCTAKITNNLSNRNLIINGAMQVAQRGTSSTVAEGYGSVDRFKSNNANNDEAPTQSQVDVASGTTPYSLGFRKAFRMTNGNQTSGAGTNDRVCIIYSFEGQDMANSGWNYISASSFITISFWVKSSVAQNFFVQLRVRDGTEQGFTFETGSLSANTWTKVTKTIPGNSNIQFDNDNTAGLLIEWNIFRGTTKTGSMSLDTWAAFDGSTRTPDQTSTWYTTDDATFEITGVQLEVGSVATDFEHRSFAQELALCQRYCQVLGGNTSQELFMTAYGNGAGTATGFYQAPVDFRSTPSFSISNLSHVNIYNFTNSGNLGSPSAMSLITAMSAKHWIYIDTTVSSTTSGGGIMVRANSTNDARFTLSAEL